MTEQDLKINEAENKENFRVYDESMTRVVYHHRLVPWRTYIIRLWREENPWTEQCIPLCTKAAEKVLDEIFASNTSPGLRDIAMELLKIDRMNAVEVLDDTNNGPVLYKNWP